MNDIEPSLHEEAKGCPDWKSAIKEEFTPLIKNETWDSVSKPKGVKHVSC